MSVKLSRKHMLVRFISLIKFIIFMCIMLHSKTGHNEYCTERFPNVFCVVPINKKFLLSNALNLRFRGAQRLF